MITRIYHVVARLLRLTPKTTKIRVGDMSATFFVPISNHYVCDDLTDLSAQKREPKLYKWLNNLPAGSVYFDIGTSYGQECCLASSRKDIQVFGFDCSLYQSHFCSLNRALNHNRFTFTFAAISDVSGQVITIESNSDTHIPKLHKKNVPYEYQVTTLSLDDFSKSNNVIPTHIKIDVDGAEDAVLRGASSILASGIVQDVFIEVDRSKMDLVDHMLSLGFEIKWQLEKDMNFDILFSRNSDSQ